MAQAGYTPIQLYYSTTASAAPSSGNLANGELAINITDGKLYYKDNGGTVQVLATKAGASGDVVGPGSSTDNALVRFDGTTGKLVQNSAGILDDSGNLTGLAAVTMSGALTLSGGTANGVAYLNGSKVLTTGSALTFDGTNLGVGGAALSLPAGYVVSQVSGTSGAGLFRATSTSVDIRFQADQVGSVGLINVASNHPLAFNVNATEQMRLTSTGLGIGTSSPGAKLQVGDAGSAAPVRILIRSASADTYLQSTSTGSVIGTPNGVPLIFNTNDAERMRLSADGNLGLGVTPSASTVPTLQLASQVTLSSGGNSASFAQNAIRDTSWKYITTAAATLYQHAAGAHFWYTAPSGTAGNAISFAQAMTLDASGNLLVGATSSSGRLTIKNPSVSGSQTILAVQNAASTGTIGSVTFNQDTDAFGVINNTSGGALFFSTNASERARIDSSGNLDVAYSSGTAKGRLSTTAGDFVISGTNGANVIVDPAGGFTDIKRNGTLSARFDSSGNFLVGTTSASAGSRLYVKGSGNTGATYTARIDNSDATLCFAVEGGGAIFTGTATNSPYNATTASGANVTVSSNGQLLRSTSSLKYKTDVQDATHGLAEVMLLRSVTYKGKSESDAGKTFGGLIAEEVHDAGLTEFVQYAEDGTPDALAYGNMVSLCIKAIQEQQAIINAQAAALEQLKAQLTSVSEDVAALKAAA